MNIKGQALDMYCTICILRITDVDNSRIASTAGSRLGRLLVMVGDRMFKQEVQEPGYFLKSWHQMSKLLNNC